MDRTVSDGSLDISSEVIQTEPDYESKYSEPELNESSTDPNPISEEPEMSDSAPTNIPTTSMSSSAISAQPANHIPLGINRLRVATPVPYTTKYGRAVKQPDQARIYSLVSAGAEPNTFNQAIKSPDAEQWKRAMQDELDSLIKQNVWSLVKLPLGVKAIKSRWVFKIKLGSDNQPIRYKARIVAKGFQQQYGIDYNETFAPVVKIKSLKILLSLAAMFDLELKQLDFDTAFLNASLAEDVYMVQPDGFHNGNRDTVCKLNKALYGLK
jgi:hypothetical protein